MEEEMDEHYSDCMDHLSSIVSFDSITRTVNERAYDTLLRPVLIDGPLIGVSYEQNYRLDDRLSTCSSYLRRPKTEGKRFGFVAPYPVPALTKILFHFIARGHKATAFLPQFSDDTVERILHNAKNFATVADAAHFVELVRLKLIQFLPGESFGDSLKWQTAKCQGTLVTTQKASYFNSSTTAADSANQNGVRNESEKGLCNLMFSTRMLEVQHTKNMLPVIIPLWRPYNRRLIISADTTRSKEVLEVKERDIRDSSQSNEVLLREQLTLQRQFELLKKLAKMLNGDFPCGLQDAQIVPLIKHELELIDGAKRLLKTNDSREKQKATGAGRILTFHF
ncbi:unnamed protein product [Gongylonema pulchrum]|uniref:RNase_Zc3h12a_2 domain-containing protein n=1 Tax=Gongylonema pulchrum TaxID=637853 RepID=A0A183E2R2_9BILA|nr:unnamed protein product [Gongylonema pulchrum]